MRCMLMDLLHGFEVLSTTEETLFNSKGEVGRNLEKIVYQMIFAQTSSTRSEISQKKLSRKIFTGNFSTALQSLDTFDDVIAKE